MLDSYSDSPGDAPWSIEEIPYHLLDRQQVQDDSLLFYIVVSASFIEITSHLYTKNLAAFFCDDPEIVEWLETGWEPEEMQHGASLKRYVQTAWPDFDWEAAYRDFLVEYARLCTHERYADTRSLEMVARCVVETGTSSFYRMLTVFKTLWDRAMEIDDEDAFIAFKHAFLARNPGVEFQRQDYDDYRSGVRRLGKEHFPYDMALKMFLKPLGLGPAISRMVLPPAAAATRLLLLR